MILLIGLPSLHIRAWDGSGPLSAPMVHAQGTAGTLRKPLAPTPVIADASDQLWRKYCATRLRQFAAGR